MEDWTPTEEYLHEVVNLFNIDMQIQNGTQRQAQAKLEEMVSYQEFNNYLTFIFVHSEIDPNSRVRAGLQLKNNIRSEQVFEQTLPYIMNTVMHGLADMNRVIRNTTGTIITIIISKYGIHKWPGLLEFLYECLSHENEDIVDGALNTIAKICEDEPMSLDNEKLNRPLNTIIPKFIEFFYHPNDHFRVSALTAVLNYIPYLPQAMVANMDDLLKGLFFLMDDKTPKIKQRVCESFVNFVSFNGASYIQPHMDTVLEYILYILQDENDVVGLSACEFIIPYIKWAGINPLLSSMLDRLIPALISAMRYTDLDVNSLGYNDQSTQPDSEKDVAPYFVSAREVHYNSDNTYGDLDDDNFDDDDDYYDDAEWDDGDDQNLTLRRYAAMSLDRLTSLYKDDIIEPLLPALEVALANADDWRVKESGIIALGAVALGCQNGIQHHLPELLPFLLDQLESKYVLIRSITCWTVSRYEWWLLLEGNHDNFVNAFQGVLRRTLDTSKYVQETACCAVTEFAEKAKLAIVPYLQPTMEILMEAFQKYQTKNLMLLCDTISVVVQVVGTNLNQQKYLQLVAPPVLRRFHQIVGFRTENLPIYELMQAIASAFGTNFSGWAPDVYAKCIEVIQEMLEVDSRYKNAKRMGRHIDPPNKDYIISALDLISSLMEGLEQRVDSLVQDSSILDFVRVCACDVLPDVRQAAFAVLGELARFCINRLYPHLDKFITLAADNLNIRHTKVANNASWAIGEISLRVGANMAPMVPMLMERMCDIMTSNSLIPLLAENVAITITRLGYVCPQEVAGYLDSVASPLCHALATVANSADRDSAFMGLFELVQANPGGVSSMEAFGQLCICVARCVASQNRNDDLNNKLGSMMHAMKQNYGDHWPSVANMVDDEVMNILQNYLNL